jgi:hypothetical protein
VKTESTYKTGEDCSNNRDQLTAVLQLLLNTFDSIYLPTGDYSINATLTRTTGNLILTGDGMNRSRIIRSKNFGDSLLLAAVDPTTTRLSNLTIRDLTFRSTTLMTSGAHLHIKDYIHADIRNIHFWNGFISMHYEGLQQAVVTNTRIDTGAYYSTGIQSGSKFVLIQDSTNPANETGEVFFSDFNWTHTGYTSVETGLEIQAADGLWFSNGHILGAATECKINPQTASTSLAGVLFSQVWFDGLSKTNLKFTGNSAVYKNFRFTGCRFSGAQTRAIESSPECLKLQNIQFIGCDIGENQGEGARFTSGDKIIFSGCHTFDTGLADHATTKAIIVGLGVGQFSYTGGTVGTTTGTPLLMGIDIQDTTVEANISGVAFINCANEISLSGNLPLGSKLNNATTDRATVSNVVAAMSLTLPAVEDNIELTGASAKITTIKWGWHGRTIMLLATDNAQTLKHGTGTTGNIINTSSGADLVLSKGQAARLTYNGNKGGWYQSK